MERDLSYLIGNQFAKGQKPNKTAFKKGKDASGTYGMSKQKYLKKMFGQIKTKIAKTDSILILVSQVIDNINAGFMGPKKTVAGGHGPEFNCRIRGWLIRVLLSSSSDSQNRSVRPVLAHKDSSQCPNHHNSPAAELIPWSATTPSRRQC